MTRELTQTQPQKTRPQDIPTEQALAWFAHLRAPALTASDRAAFEAWRAADPTNAAAYAEVEALWSSPELTAAVMRRAPKRRTMRWPRTAAACAAAFLLAVALGVAVDLPMRLEADAVTAVGERRDLTLSDGSMMMLNSASAIALDMTASQRGVRLLSGEAFFDVQPDARRAFEVRAGDALVRVVGTAFSVRRTDDGVYVAVLRGAVQVSAAGNGSAALRLGPGDIARVADGQAEMRGRGPVEDFLAWRDGRFVFRDRPLASVIAALARYHKGWVVIADDRLSALPVSGNYKLDDPVAIVDSLAQATGARVTRVTSRLTVLR
jgi:transmembrane sensor